MTQSCGFLHTKSHSGRASLLLLIREPLILNHEYPTITLHLHEIGGSLKALKDNKECKNKPALLRTYLLVKSKQATTGNAGTLVYLKMTNNTWLTVPSKVPFQLLLTQLDSIYVPRNLGICTISRLRCAFSESWDCVPFSRLCIIVARSRDCATIVRNLQIAQITYPWLARIANFSTKGWKATK